MAAVWYLVGCSLLTERQNRSIFTCTGVAVGVPLETYRCLLLFQPFLFFKHCLLFKVSILGVSSLLNNTLSFWVAISVRHGLHYEMG